MADTEKLVFQTDDGKEVEFEIIESTRVNGADYIWLLQTILPYMIVRMMTMTARQYLSLRIQLQRSLRKHYMSSWMMRKNLMLFSRYLSSFWMMKNRRRA